MRALVDVTDLVEFLQQPGSVSGVQRVVAQTAPLLLAEHPEATAVVLDRGRGVFVALTPEESRALIDAGASTAVGMDRTVVSAIATACLDRAAAAEPEGIDADVVLVFLGAAWINDALMHAARTAQARGARCVYLLYDLTPVLDAGHAAGVGRLFDRYLHLLVDTASAVPAISASTRRDFEWWCGERHLPAPPGPATGLPCGIAPGPFDVEESPWPRPYALFVGTVEARKNHLLALQAWERLIDRHGADAVPDLVCIGRWGWNVDDFRNAYEMTEGLGGKVHVLADGVSDADLARYYAHALFTVYPSRYEGWGLPVSESLAFGRVTIATDTSSIPEAGRDLAVYVPSDDVDALVRAVERVGLDPSARDALEARIRLEGGDPHSWEQVARDIWDAVVAAGAAEAAAAPAVVVDLGQEYSLAGGQEGGLTPMLAQERVPDEAVVVDRAVTGVIGSPQGWGYQLRPGASVDLRLARPIDGALALLLGTLARTGSAVVEVVSGDAVSAETVKLGSVISIPVPPGAAGDPVRARVTVTDLGTAEDDFLGLVSFALVAADDPRVELAEARSRVQALEHEVATLRERIAVMEQSRSWRVTAPLRRGSR